MTKNPNGFYRGQFFKEINDRFDRIDGEIRTIKENHIPHLEKRIDDLEKRA